MTENAATPPLSPSPTVQLVRPVEGRMLAGVCAGIAERWHLDVTLVRVVAVVLAALSGVGVAAYLAAWLLTPSADGPAALRPGTKASKIAAGVPVAVLVLLLAAALFGLAHEFWFGAPVSLLLLALVVAVVAGSRRLRVALLVAAALLAASLAAFGVYGDHLGSRDIHVSSVSDLRSRYEAGTGRLRLDLSAVDLSGTHRTEVRVGRGNAVVTVPADASVLVHARAGVGEVNVDGRRVRGVDVEQTRELGPATDGRRLVLDVLVGAGSVDVRTEP